VIDIVDGSQYPLTISSPGRRGDMNCDHCKYYRWYYDRCERWDCEVDAREVHNCFEGKSPVEEVDDAKEDI